MASARAKREERTQRVSARGRAEERKNSFSPTIKLPDGVNFFNMKKSGVYRIDILPYKVEKGKKSPGGNPFAEPGQLHFERTFYVHRNVGPTDSSYLCLRKNNMGKCPVCEDIAKLAMDPEHDPDTLKEMAPKERQLFNVIDLNDPDKGVQVLEMSYHLFGKLLDNKVKDADEDDGYEFFADPETGLTLKLSVGDKSFGGRTFQEVTNIEFKQRKQQYDAGEIAEQVHDLDDMLKFETYEDLKKIYFQSEDSKDDDENEEDFADKKIPTPPKGGKGPKAPAKPADEDEDEDDEKTAEDMGIEVGAIVMYGDDKCKVIHISGDGSSIRLEKVKGGQKVLGVAPSELELVEEEEDDEPKKPTSKKPGKAPPPPADDDEDEDEDEEEEEEEEEDDEPKKPTGKKPTGKKPKPKPADDDEEEEEEEDEDEEEEDDEPKKPAAKKPGKAPPPKKPTVKKPKPADDDDDEDWGDDD